MNRSRKHPCAIHFIFCCGALIYLKMEILQILGLSVLGIIMLIGLIRVVFSPYTNFVNFLMEIMLIDYLIDGLGWVLESIGDILDD